MRKVPHAKLLEDRVQGVTPVMNLSVSFPRGNDFLREFLHEEKIFSFTP